MAAASCLKDIEDKYFECSYCLENYKEPKLLPCVHRFCRDCLEAVIGKTVENFHCPLCDYLCDIPPDGVDGFRTDFHIKSLLQYIQLQQSAKTEEIKRCSGCAKEAKVTSYCFKCKGFLCEQCYLVHTTFPMMQEHKPSVLSLADLRDQNLPLERLASLRGSPRCSVHIDKGAEVCCSTCGNLPICVVCGHHGRHKGHELHDVTILAEQERGKIQQSLAAMEKYTVNVRELPLKAEKAKMKLKENIDKNKEKLRTQHAEETRKIRRQLQVIDGLLEMNKAEIDEIETQEVMVLEQEREKEIVAVVKAVNDKYDELVKEKKAKNQNLRVEQEGLYAGKRAKVNRKLSFIDEKFEGLQKFVDTQEERNSGKILNISRDAGNRKHRFENFRSSATSILASKNDWNHARCLPDMNAASVPLIVGISREHPKLEALSQVAVSDLPSFTADTVIITEHAESIVDIDGIKDFKGHKICNMTNTDAGNTIITGDVDDEHTHITVINRQCEVVRQYKVKSEDTGGNKQDHFRSCSAMSLFKVATTCMDREVGVYDTQNGTYMKKDMNDVISSWKDGDSVTCVAAVQKDKNIYVGSTSRDVYILDDELNYCRTLHLPEIVKYPIGIYLHGGHLLVCDFVGKRACIVTTEGREAELVCELPKPVHEGGDWAPFRACTDSNGFIYILFHAIISGQWGKVLTQHSQDGRRLLITKPVDIDAYGITTVMTGGAEKLLLVTLRGEMYTYGLE